MGKAVTGTGLRRAGATMDRDASTVRRPAGVHAGAARFGAVSGAAGQVPTVLVLASGRGERYAASGGRGHKLQARMAGRTVLQRTLDAVRASGLPWHLENHPHPDMGDSIAAAVRATTSASGWLVLPGDLPLICSGTLLSVAAGLARHAIVVPVFEGQRGHPVGFGRACRTALLQLCGDQGAAPVVRAFGALMMAVDDRGAVTDIDTVHDLACARLLLADGAD